MTIIIYACVHIMLLFSLYKVFARLQKLGICLSSSGTMSAVDKLGKGHDEEVLSWVDCLRPLVPTTQVN